MGDGGWRRIDAPAARHILTLLSARASGGSAAAPRPHTKGRRFIGAAFSFHESDLSRRHQRGQKPLAAPRYSITATLRRIRIW
jgi:hypothetical protein